jgi:uncharacterized membrane protein
MRWAAWCRCLLVYFLTFLVLCGMWFRHRMEFTYISSVDRLFAWLNLGFLGFVALVPWSASLVGAHPGARLTVLVYNVNLAAATSLQHLGWLYATGRRRLVGAMPAKLVRWSRLVGLLPVVDYVVAVPVSLASPPSRWGSTCSYRWPTSAACSTGCFTD